MSEVRLSKHEEDILEHEIRGIIDIEKPSFNSGFRRFLNALTGAFCIFAALVVYLLSWWVQTIYEALIGIFSKDHETRLRVRLASASSKELEMCCVGAFLFLAAIVFFGCMLLQQPNIALWTAGWVSVLLYLGMTYVFTFRD